MTVQRYVQPMTWLVLTAAILLAPIAPVHARDDSLGGEAKANDAKMNWWRHARFGMFIHWGIYAVPADGEWYMTNAHVPKAKYEQYAREFNPQHFDAAKWVKVAKDARMKYLVITSKHHDGFCMFNTKATDYNVVDATPWHHDPLKDLAEQCRKQGVRFCVYYSIMDWHHPDQAPAKDDPQHPTYNPTKMRDGRKADYVQYMKTQLKELIDQYHPGLIWFDGDWPSWWTTDDGKDLYAYLMKLDPDLIVNNRIKGAGDYGTPEQHIPAGGLPGDWETCMTINGSWGYTAGDHSFKSAESLLHNLIDIVSKGGNYLLNVGPTADGVIPQPEIDHLEAMGQWLDANGESIYGASASPFKTMAWGRCTTKVHDDGTATLYLNVFDWPADGKLLVPVDNKVRDCHLLNDSHRTFNTTSDQAAGTIVHLTGDAPDKISSVVVLDIEGKPNGIIIPIPQQPDGTITLKPGDAEAHAAGGYAPRSENKNGHDNIGYWYTAGSTVSWRFKVDHPGKFDVSAPLGTPSKTSRLTIEVAGQKLTAAVPDTGSYDTYKPLDFGTVTISKPGVYDLVVRPVADHWSPVNLRTITLKPVH